MKYVVHIERSAIQKFTVEAESKELARDAAMNEASHTVIAPYQCDSSVLKVEEVKE